MKHKMLENIEAILFDLDGTLIDSMWMWRTIDIEYLARFHIPLPENLQNVIEGMSFTETAHYFKDHFAIKDDIETIKDDWNKMAWDKYENEVPMKPGAIEFLSYCKLHGIKLGIATSNSRELVNNIIRVHQLEDYFTVIITGCDVQKGKPAPDIYLTAARELNVSCSKCLVFEDIIPGIQAGKAAGMKVCAVEDDYSADSRTQKQDVADYYIEDYYELLSNII